MPAPRTRRFHPVLLLVIIVILAAIGHVVLVGLHAAAVDRVHLRCPRPRQDR